MKQATKEDLLKESQGFADAWELLKKWYFIDGTDQQWLDLINEARLIPKDNNKLVSDITTAVLSYIELAYKEREGIHD